MSPSDTESANGGTSTISRIWPVVRKNRMELREHVVGVMYLKGGSKRWMMMISGTFVIRCWLL